MIICIFRAWPSIVILNYYQYLISTYKSKTNGNKGWEHFLWKMGYFSSCSNVVLKCEVYNLEILSFDHFSNRMQTTITKWWIPIRHYYYYNHRMSPVDQVKYEIEDVLLWLFFDPIFLSFLCWKRLLQSFWEIPSG